MSKSRWKFSIFYYSRCSHVYNWVSCCEIHILDLV